MTARLASVALGTIVLALGATACGGDDSNDLSAESQAVVTEIERICDDADVAGFTATFDDVEVSRTVIDEAADELGVSREY